jgi:surfeit locus 1 family protein
VSRKLIAFVALAVVLAAVFVWLGFWQLDRLSQRRARNAALRERLDAPVTRLDRLGADAAYRRATIDGVPDDANEVVFTGRSRHGSPGVYLLTPLRRPANDTAVLVVRGWVYAPDAATVDVARWREARRSYSGYVLALPAGGAPPRGPTVARRIRSLTHEGVSGMLPYPVAPYYLVAQDSAPSSAPARLDPLALDDGPHLGYAIQWFAFAAIALVGAAVVVARSRAGATGAGSTGA